MKKHMVSILFVLSWISLAPAAQPQPGSADVSARVFNSTDISVPQLTVGEWKTLTFDLERWDTANLHDIAANISRLRAPVAGEILHFRQHHVGNSARQRLLGTTVSVKWKNTDR